MLGTAFQSASSCMLPYLDAIDIHVGYLKMRCCCKNQTLTLTSIGNKTNVYTQKSKFKSTPSAYSDICTPDY